jgi:hypothetical protein
MMSLLIYRVQGIDGRGPWRPGFSHRWVEDCDRPLPPPWFEEFGTKIMRGLKATEFVGCGCRTLEQIDKWFIPRELDRLCVLGFHLVCMEVDRVIAESENQIVFARSKPLALDVETIERTRRLAAFARGAYRNTAVTVPSTK